MSESFLIKLQASTPPENIRKPMVFLRFQGVLRPATLFQERLWHMCSLVTCEISINTFSTEHLPATASAFNSLFLFCYRRINRKIHKTTCNLSVPVTKWPRPELLLSSRKFAFMMRGQAKLNKKLKWQKVSFKT